MLAGRGKVAASRTGRSSLIETALPTTGNTVASMETVGRDKERDWTTGGKMMTGPHEAGEDASGSPQGRRTV